MARKLERNPNAEFGIFDYSFIPKLRRLLKVHGLKLKTRSNYAQWGDQIEVWVEREPMPSVKPKVRVCSKCNGTGEQWFHGSRIHGGPSYIGKCVHCKGTGKAK